MELILEIITIEDIVKFCIILFFSFIGSIAKDYLKILRYTNKSKFNFIEIFLSMITASYKDKIIDEITYQNMIQKLHI